MKHMLYTKMDDLQDLDWVKQSSMKHEFNVIPAADIGESTNTQRFL